MCDTSNHMGYLVTVSYCLGIELNWMESKTHPSYKAPIPSRSILLSILFFLMKIPFLFLIPLHFDPSFRFDSIPFLFPPPHSVPFHFDPFLFPPPRSVPFRSIISIQFDRPPNNSVTGKVIPRLFNKHKHRRRVSLEIHRVTPILANDSSDIGEDGKKETTTTTTDGEPKKSYSYHESVLRILVPASKELSRQYKIDAMKKIHSKAGSTSSSDSLREINEAIYDHDENNDDDDDGTVSSSSNDESSRYYELADHGGKEYEGWKPKYSIPMYGIYIRGHKKKTVNILISFNDFKQEREIIFDTIHDTKLFLKEIEKQKRLENTRQDERLQSALGDDISLPKFETITFLFEIVSAYDIPIGDYTTSDPYVTAFLGHQEIHRTKHLSKTLNPIWTLKTGSLFLLTVESKRFFIEDGMKFVLKDYDQIGHHDVLGVVNVEPKILYNSTGQRLSYKLQPPPNSKLKEVPGILIIRCRRASQYDQKFMTDYEKKGEGMKGVSRYVAPVSNTNVFKTITTKVKKRDKHNIVHVSFYYIV